MNIDKDAVIEVDYKFHNNAAFLQIELGLKEKDGEEWTGLSQIRPTMQTRDTPTIKGGVHWPWPLRSLGGSPRLFSRLSIDYK